MQQKGVGATESPGNTPSHQNSLGHVSYGGVKNGDETNRKKRTQVLRGEKYKVAMIYDPPTSSLINNQTSTVQSSKELQ